VRSSNASGLHLSILPTGVIDQVGEGTTIYDQPVSAFVASFVGENNMFRGKAIEVNQDYTVVETDQGPIRARSPKTENAALAKGDAAFVFIRPESLKFAASGEFENRVKADIVQSEFEGNFWQVYFKLPDDKIGSRVELGFNPDLAVALPQGPLASE
jgi:spermidine/putrescine transport system ATP-binding protein